MGIGGSSITWFDGSSGGDWCRRLSGLTAGVALGASSATLEWWKAVVALEPELQVEERLWQR
ncbi:hypothetical protein U1Q18_035593 [Sarracenia purpurea var. burkii]